MDLELLAPVGSMDSLYAAVANGANAVYLGGKMFNARKYASNFDYDELREAVNYCHLRDVKVFVTVNILLDNSEMKAALEYTKYLYDIGVDALIVQDLGYAKLVRELLPDFELHGSTQMTVNNLEGANFLYEMGFKRVVLAREVPLEEIKYISENSPIELEVFIHGALCVSYSGQCLMSSMIGGRSGNRGSCAQPCRMPSSLVDSQGNLVGDWENKHILSPRDLNTIEEISQLIEAGVISYKIEGRMKRPEYVATVVGLYRKAMDLGSNSLGGEDMEDLEQIFNRGFTKGLGFGAFGQDYISYTRPDNRGLVLGKVIGLENGQVQVELERDLNRGDGIEFQLANGSYRGQKVDQDLRKGEVGSFKKIGPIRKGSLVYRTSSEALLEEARKSYEELEYKREIRLDIHIGLGEAARLKAYYKDLEIEVVGDYIVEPSKKVALDGDRVMDQLSKLGDTVYEIADYSLDLGENLFMPMSALNAMRREMTTRLDEMILKGSRKSLGADEFQADLKRLLEVRDRREDLPKGQELSIAVRSLELLKRLDLNKLDRIYLNLDSKNDLAQALDLIEGKNIGSYLMTGKILYREDFKELKELLDLYGSRLDGVTVANIGSLEYIRRNYDLKIHGDLGLNVFNSYTADFLLDSGLDSLDLSIELTMEQIGKIAKDLSSDLGVLAYGYIPVMTMGHCPMALYKGCKDSSNCGTCSFREGYSIRDRISKEFRFTRRAGITSIYNSVPILILDSLTMLENMELGSIRMDFNFRDEDLEELQDYYYRQLEGLVRPGELDQFLGDYRRKKEITKGHYFRGIMG